MPNLREQGTDSIVQLQQERAAKRYVDVLRNKINKLNKFLWDNNQPILADYYPGKTVPYCFSKFYQVTAAVTQANADLSAYVVPDDGNIIVNREGVFHLCEINVVTYSSTNLWIGVVEGGGATAVSAGGSGLSLDLYDKKRGISFSDEPIFLNWCSSGAKQNRKLVEPIVLDVDTELEPRLIKHSISANTYVNILFKGFKVLE